MTESATQPEPQPGIEAAEPVDDESTADLVDEDDVDDDEVYLGPVG